MARVLAGTPTESKNKAMIAAAVLFAAIAAVLLFVALQNRGGEEESVGPTTAQVVVAARGIDANTKITTDMIQVKSLPLDQLLAGAYRDAKAVVGLPTRYPLQKGEQVTTTKVGVQAIEDEKDLALVLEQGQRAFAVEATEVTAVGGLLLPGNSVDVIAVLGDETGGVRKAVTVLQDVQVLGVAQEAQEPVPVGASTGETTDETRDAAVSGGIRGQRPEEVERQPGARSVTLAVTPEQAQLLASLQSQDDVEIWLSLRPVDDTQSLPLNETNLLDFYSPPPARP